MMHNANDVMVEFEADLISRAVTIRVDSIDTLILERLLRFTMLSYVKEELESIGKLPLLTNMSRFSIELVVASKVRFNLRLVERDFEPREPTLAMSLLS
jgi:hypothetical protein